MRDEYNLCKTKRTMRTKIENILINIWFNYSSSSGFHTKNVKLVL